MKKHTIFLGNISIFCIPFITVISCSNNRNINNEENINNEKNTNNPLELHKVELENFLNKIKDQTINLDKLNPEAKREIAYMKYLLKKGNGENFSIYSNDQKNLKLKIFWPFEKDIQKIKSNNYEDSVNNFDNLGRIVEIPHMDHFHYVFKKWTELPPRNEEEEKILEIQKEDQEKNSDKKGYIYSFSVKQNQIDWKNVLVKQDLFKHYKNADNFGNKKQQLNINFFDMESDKDEKEKVKNIFHQGERVFFWQIEKEKFINQLIDYSKDYLHHYEDTKLEKIEFKEDTAKDFLVELLESLVNEKKLTGSTFLDWYFTDFEDEKLSSKMNNFIHKIFISDKQLKFQEGIINTILKHQNNPNSKIGFDEVKIPNIFEKLLNPWNDVSITKYLENVFDGQEKKINEFNYQKQKFFEKFKTDFKNGELLLNSNDIDKIISEKISEENFRTKYKEFFSNNSYISNKNLENDPFIKNVLENVVPKLKTNELKAKNLYWYINKNNEKKYLESKFILVRAVNYYEVRGNSLFFGDQIYYGHDVLEKSKIIDDFRILYKNNFFATNDKKIGNGKSFSQILEEKNFVDLNVNFFSSQVFKRKNNNNLFYVVDSHDSKVFKTAKDLQNFEKIKF